MPARIPRLFGSVLLLLGAFAIGGVLHQSLVKGEFALTSPPAVFGFVAGVVLIVVGNRLEQAFDPSDYVPASEDGNEEKADEEGFDEELSPVPSERLEGREKDESYGER